MNSLTGNNPRHLYVGNVGDVVYCSQEGGKSLQLTGTETVAPKGLGDRAKFTLPIIKGRSILLTETIGNDTAKLFAYTAGTNPDDIMKRIFIGDPEDFDSYKNLLTKHNRPLIWQYAPLIDELSKNGKSTVFGNTKTEGFLFHNATPTFAKTTEQLGYSPLSEVINISSPEKDIIKSAIIKGISRVFDHNQENPYAVLQLDHGHSGASWYRVDRNYNVYLGSSEVSHWTLDQFIADEVPYIVPGTLTAEVYHDVDPKLCPSIGYHVDANGTVTVNQKDLGAILQQNFDDQGHFSGTQTIDPAEYEHIIPHMEQQAQRIVTEMIRKGKEKGIHFEGWGVIDFMMLDASSMINQGNMKGTKTPTASFRGKEYYIFAKECNPRCSGGSATREAQYHLSPEGLLHHACEMKIHINPRLITSTKASNSEIENEIAKVLLKRKMVNIDQKGGVIGPSVSGVGKDRYLNVLMYHKTTAGIKECKNYLKELFAA